MSLAMATMSVNFGEEIGAFCFDLPQVQCCERAEIFLELPDGSLAVVVDCCFETSVVKEAFFVPNLPHGAQLIQARAFALL